MAGIVSSRTVCRWLRVSASGLKQMSARGELTPVVCPAVKGGRALYYFDADAVNLLVQSSGRARRRRHEPLPVPAGRDDDVTLAEAALMLGMGQGAVSWLIKRGFLMAQSEKREGHPKRLWIARSEVARLKADPERTAARLSYDQRRFKPFAPVEPMTEDEYERYREFTLLTVVEAGRYLGVASVTILKLRNYGRIDSRKIKGRIWVKRESLEALLCDPVYLERRQRFRKANTEEVRLLRNSGYVARIIKVAEVRRPLLEAMDW